MIKIILQLHRNLSIVTKVIVGIIFFTFFLGGMERYYISENVTHQFLEAKKSKNMLLLNTISMADSC